MTRTSGIAVVCGAMLIALPPISAMEASSGQVLRADGIISPRSPAGPATEPLPGRDQSPQHLAQSNPVARVQRPPAAAPQPVQPSSPVGTIIPPEESRTPAGAPANQLAPPQIPTRTEILNFDSWVVTCNEFAERARQRVCQAVLQIVQQNTNQIVFNWTIVIDNNKQLVTIMQTPTGVAIAPGVELQVGKSPARKIPFASCETARCIATLAMDSTLLQEMSAATTAEAVIQGSQGNTVQFNIQLKGFDRAFAALTRS